MPVRFPIHQWHFGGPIAGRGSARTHSWEVGRACHARLSRNSARPLSIRSVQFPCQGVHTTHSRPWSRVRVPVPRRLLLGGGRHSGPWCQESAADLAGSPWAGDPPGLPQIRTCGFPASASFPRLSWRKRAPVRHAEGKPDFGVGCSDPIARGCRDDSGDVSDAQPRLFSLRLRFANYGPFAASRAGSRAFISAPRTGQSSAALICVCRAGAREPSPGGVLRLWSPDVPPRPPDPRRSGGTTHGHDDVSPGLIL